MGTHVWREIEFSQDAGADTQPSLLMLLEQLDYQQGEKRLMLAVLKDAVECIEHYSSGRGSQSLPVYRAALRWVFARDQEWPFSFENICLALDLDPARFRFTLCSPLPLSTGKAPTRLPASQRLASQL